MAVLQALPRVRHFGRCFVGHIKSRPDEPSVEHARQHAGAVLIDEGAQPVAEGAEARRKRRFDTAYRSIEGGVWKYVDFMKVAVITNENLEEACRQQGVAVEAGDKGKFYSYRKSISNLDELRQRGVVHFASSDYCGTISEGYDKLLKIIASDVYPGDFGSIDVDGLRSLCVSRLRVAVGAGIWRANHKTLGAWAERAYPERHRIDDNDKN